MLPDACANVLIRCDDGGPSVIVSGIQTKEHEIDLAPNAQYFGFKPFCICGMRDLGFSWHDLADSSLDMSESMAARPLFDLAEELRRADSFDKRCERMNVFAHAALADPGYTASIAEYSELKMCNARGTMSLQSLADSTGYTEQYCRKRFKGELGLTMKTYSSIMRFQNAVRNMEDRNVDMLDVVYKSGYYDQSHMNREFKRFSGTTPERFRKRYMAIA